MNFFSFFWIWSLTNPTSNNVLRAHELYKNHIRTNRHYGVDKKLYKNVGSLPLRGTLATYLIYTPLPKHGEVGL